MKSDSSKTEQSPSSQPPSRVRTFVNGFAIGVLATAAAAWFIVQQGRKHPEAQERFQQATSNTVDAAGEALFQAGQALKAKIEMLDLKTEQVQEELARTGKVVRRRAREVAAQVSDAAADTRITAAITAKFVADRDLSVWKIAVHTSDGHVTLEGSVSAADHVAKAVALAMEVDGVRDVTSNLKVTRTIQ